MLHVLCLTHLPRVQDALQQMRPGAVARVQTRLSFLGHDPTGLVPRCPVEIQVKAALKQPGLVGSPAIFTPTLASQRHELALQVCSFHLAVCQDVAAIATGFVRGVQVW